MRAHVEHEDTAGVVTLMARGGEVHVDAIGAADLASGAPVRRGTLFRVSSMTKPVTAAAALILVEDRKLALDEPVDRWLPELARRRVLTRLDATLDDTEPARRAITLRDLLTCRAGVGAVMAPPGRYPIQRAIAEAGLSSGPYPPALAPDEWLARLGRLPLMHQPGERWAYHTAFDILAVLIARASGESLGDFLSQRIFGPLGMKDTGFHVPGAKLGRLATCYRADGATGRLGADDEARGRFAKPPLFDSGANGLVSTADDFLAFELMLLDGGRNGDRRLLSEQSVALMTRDHIPPEQKKASPFFPGFWEHRGWGFGLSVVTQDEDGGPPAGSFGWDGGLCTSAYCDPRMRTVAILLAQIAIDSGKAANVLADFWRGVAALARE
jgi:CubicO group peptidase (beta-lactamase class C family)